MIYHDWKAVHIHIPKCAGSTIEQEFAPGVNPTKFDWNYFTGFSKSHRLYLQHAPAQSVRDFYDHDLSEYFWFAYVRNPWAKAVSDFHWMPKQKHNTFEDYLLVKNGFEEILKPKKFRRTWRGDHIWPQDKFLLGRDGELLVDFVGKVEDFEAGMTHICEKIGRNPCVKLPKANKGHYRGGYRSHYEHQWMIDLIAERDQWVIEEHGYEF